jgi:hypothetical protein
MGYEYCCFISYPHGQDNVLVPFVEDFVKGLETEIKAIMRRKVWVDYNFIKGGNRLDEEIGPDICRSVCMILLYTPLYFDTEHTYCARELKAMQDLESQRLKSLKDKGKGLIIPIVLRGEKRFPKVLSESRVYYRFTDIEFNDPKLKISEKYAKELKEIAEYIFDRCEQLDQVAGKSSHDCESFCLPSPEDAKRFVETVLGKTITDVAVPFVVRTDQDSSV